VEQQLLRKAWESVILAQGFQSASLGGGAASKERFISSGATGQNYVKMLYRAKAGADLRCSIVLAFPAFLLLCRPCPIAAPLYFHANVINPPNAENASGGVSINIIFHFMFT